MGKLVRDRIPEIIEANGDTALTRVLEAREYEAALLDKLLEEAQELYEAPPDNRLDEAADVYEVLRAVAGIGGFSIDDVVERATTKRGERGGFTQRLWLGG